MEMVEVPLEGGVAMNLEYAAEIADCTEAQGRPIKSSEEKLLIHAN